MQTRESSRQGQYVVVHRLDNDETITAYKRGGPEWQTLAETRHHLALIIEHNATRQDPAGYTGDLGLFGRRSALGEHMKHTIVDDWIVAKESWSPKTHDSMRTRIAGEQRKRNQ